MSSQCLEDAYICSMVLMSDVAHARRCALLVTALFECAGDRV